MSWRDELGNRRGDDEDWDTVQAELARDRKPESLLSIVRNAICRYRRDLA